MFSLPVEAKIFKFFNFKRAMLDPREMDYGEPMDVDWNGTQQCSWDGRVIAYINQQTSYRTGNLGAEEYYDEPMSTWEEKILDYESEIESFENEAQRLRDKVVALKNEVAFLQLQQKREKNDQELINKLRGTINLIKSLVDLFSTAD
jgi:hypothetical protein